MDLELEVARELSERWLFYTSLECQRAPAMPPGRVLPSSPAGLAHSFLHVALHSTLPPQDPARAALTSPTLGLVSLILPRFASAPNRVDNLAWASRSCRL